MRKRIAAKVGFFWGKTIQKWLSENRTFIRLCFFYKSISLQNLMRCKFFFRNLTRSKIFNSKLVELWKNGSKSDAFKILDSKYDALYNKRFKNWIFWKFLIQKFFIKEQNKFSRNNFSMNAQKSQLWNFHRVHWPDRTIFESEFSNKFWFYKNSFLIESWCVVKILIQVLTLCGYSSYTLTRSSFFV